MHNDPRSRTAASPHSLLKPLKNQLPKCTKAPNPGAFVFLIRFFCFNTLKPGTPPAVTLTGDSIHHPFRGPWYRQAGDSPLYTGLIPQRDEPTLLGSLVQAGRGFPLYTGPTLTAKSTRFGNPDTGRSGLPAFTPIAEVFSPALIKLRTFG